MVLGIGTDIIEISRVANSIRRHNFLEKNYTDEEIDLIDLKGAQTAAGNFAAKEAVSKALGTGFKSFGLKDIEILRDDTGKPYVKLYNNAKEIAESLNMSSIMVSISHSKEFAVAFAVLEGADK